MDEAIAGIRAAHFLASIGLFRFLVSALLFPVVETHSWGARDVALVAAITVFVTMSLWLEIEAQAITREDIATEITNGDLWTVLTKTRFGQIYLWRAAILVMVGVVLCVRGRPAMIGATIGAGLSLALIAETGHAGATGGDLGLIHLSADMLHLLAVGAWIGSLLPFAWIVSQRHSAGPSAFELASAETWRFSNLGLACVGLIVVTGSINTWFMVGNLQAPALLSSDYVRLLAIKVTIFAVIIGIAGFNRLRLAPRVSGKAGTAALASLKWTALLEAAAGIVIVAIVGELGTLPPT